MRKIIAIIGLPATGKSTIMKKFLEKASPTWECVEEVPLVTAHYSPTRDVYVLGKYEEGEKFPGTDRYSMAVQPAAIKFVQTCKDNIVFEGDRLNTVSFLEFLAEQPDTELQILVITANPAIIESRHKDRADTQSEQFKKGRETKIENVRSNFMLMDNIKTFEHNTPQDTDHIVEYLTSQLPEL